MVGMYVATARRLILRRALGGLLGMAATQAVKAQGGYVGQAPVPTGVFQSHPSLVSAGDDEAASMKRRRSLARPLSRKRDQFEAEIQRRWEARWKQDMDLEALGSTSHAWRTGVMADRLKARQSVMDTLNQRINAIWEEPLERLEALVAGWLRGDEA